jgi:hypothetical protein
MTAQRIPDSIREQIAERAGNRCQYCLTSERIIGPLLEIDHVLPQSRGGTDDLGNLVLACPHCNSRKSSRVAAVDSESGEEMPLFNPLVDRWDTHFAWREGGAVLIGKTGVGRATVEALQMNHPALVTARALWVRAGWHPPSSGDTESSSISRGPTPRRA